MTVERLTWTIPEAAQVLGVSEWTVRRMVAQGVLPLVPHTGRRRLISKKRLEEWLEKKEAS